MPREARSGARSVVSALWTLDYTSFDKPSHIEGISGTSSKASTLVYDDARALLVRHDVITDGSSSDGSITYYAGGGLFEETFYATGAQSSSATSSGAAGESWRL
jgi:hypothetical protein